MSLPLSLLGRLELITAPSLVTLATPRKIWLSLSDFCQLVCEPEISMAGDLSENKTHPPINYIPKLSHTEASQLATILAIPWGHPYSCTSLP